MASEPCIAGGRHIERMSAGSLCARCRFRPGERLGDTACPFTMPSWDFPIRHEALLAANPRTLMQVKNLARVGEDGRARIVSRAKEIRSGALDA